MDLSNSIILPREDYIDLQTAAWTQVPPTFKDRAGNIAQTTALVSVFTGAFVAGVWGWAKVLDWREERAFQRKAREARRIADANRD